MASISVRYIGDQFVCLNSASTDNDPVLTALTKLVWGMNTWQKNNGDVYPFIQRLLKTERVELKLETASDVHMYEMTYITISLYTVGECRGEYIPIYPLSGRYVVSELGSKRNTIGRLDSSEITKAFDRLEADIKFLNIRTHTPILDRVENAIKNHQLINEELPTPIIEKDEDGSWTCKFSIRFEKDVLDFSTKYMPVGNRTDANVRAYFEKALRGLSHLELMMGGLQYNRHLEVIFNNKISVND